MYEYVLGSLRVTLTILENFFYKMIHVQQKQTQACTGKFGQTWRLNCGILVLQNVAGS